VSDIGLVDELEAVVRREGIKRVRQARKIWEEELGQAKLSELDALADSEGISTVEFLSVIQGEAERIWMDPHRRKAEIIGSEDRDGAEVLGALRRAISQFEQMREGDLRLVGSVEEALATLAAVELFQRSVVGAESLLPEGDQIDEPGVVICNPLDIRARRFRAVFICGLQDGVFPQEPQVDPFLDLTVRNALARSSGLILSPENASARERFLFYACTSRPEDVLYLSWRSSDEEGSPLQRSPFIDEVCSLFDDSLWEKRGRRLLADVTWPPSSAPTLNERRRSLAAIKCEDDERPGLSAPISPTILARLAARERVSARELESFAQCGVRWLVESVLRPNKIDPDPEALWRGALAHRLLERTLKGLEQATGSARITSESLPEAFEQLDGALSEEAKRRSGDSCNRELVVLRSLEVELRRYLRYEAEHPSGYDPLHLEWSFGGDSDLHGPLALDIPEQSGRERCQLKVAGRIDRIDVHQGGGLAIIRDYKGRVVHPGKSWEEDRRLQIALYMLAVSQLLGLRASAGLYQPLSGRDVRPRGLVVEETPGSYFRTDIVDELEFEEKLKAIQTQVAAAGGEMLAGKIEPCPNRCGPNGCSYPTICRVEG
jgi:hypothetical protein